MFTQYVYQCWVVLNYDIPVTQLIPNSDDVTLKTNVIRLQFNFLDLWRRQGAWLSS